MNKALALCLLLGSALPALAQERTVVLTDVDYLKNPTAANLEFKYGFRDLRFETDTTHIAGLKLLQKGAGSLYVRPADNQFIAGARVGITYGFILGRLASVQLVATQPADGQRLLAALRAMYGQDDLLPSQLRPYFPFLHVWTTQRTSLRFDMAADGSFHASIVSTKLYGYFAEQNRVRLQPGEL